MSFLRKITTKSSKILTEDDRQAPKLFILADTCPSQDDPEQVEWILQITLRDDIHGTSPSDRNPQSAPVNARDGNHYYYSRLRPHHSASHLAKTILKIFLCSLAPTVSAEDVAEILAAVQRNTDSGSYLRQALLALQISQVIPDRSSGLEINKFLRFTKSYLANHVPQSEETATVNYSKVVKDNERLRAALSSDDRLQCGMQNEARSPSLQTCSILEQDMWRISACPRPRQRYSFWHTREPGADVHGKGLGSQERDVYGGLM